MEESGEDVEEEEQQERDEDVEESKDEEGRCELTAQLEEEMALSAGGGVQPSEDLSTFVWR